MSASPASASPASADSPSSAASAASPASSPETASAPPAAPAAVVHRAEVDGRQRYGEAVVREVLGATFLGEEILEPAVSVAGGVELPAEGIPDAAPAPRDPDQPSSADAPDPFRDEY